MRQTCVNIDRGLLVRDFSMSTEGEFEAIHARADSVSMDLDFLRAQITTRLGSLE